MHINVRDPRFHCTHNRELRSKHRFVYELLVVSKFTIDRKRTRDITRIFFVLCTHVQQRHVAIFNHLVIWGTSMTIMQDASAAATCTDIGITLMSTAPPKVSPMLKQTLQLELTHARLSLIHCPAVSLATDFVNMSQQCKLTFGFNHTTFNQNVVQETVVHSKLFNSLKLWNLHVLSTISIQPMTNVHNLWVHIQQIVEHIRQKVDLVHPVLGFETLGVPNLTHGDCIPFWKLWKEQNRLACIHMNRPKHIGFLDPKQVGKVGLLAKQRLAVGTVQSGTFPALQDDHRPGRCLFPDLGRDPQPVLAEHLHIHRVQIQQFSVIGILI
mmetsp:Transcript_9684/g.15903  ORF Transcript_9684/g.15903 Transcript_9684/m.15903 type:complete len:326 (+) Transcript_9684:573-1550(+)